MASLMDALVIILKIIIGNEYGMISMRLWHIYLHGGKLLFGQSYPFYQEDSLGFNWEHKLGRDILKQVHSPYTVFSGIFSK